MALRTLFPVLVAFVALTGCGPGGGRPPESSPGSAGELGQGQRTLTIVLRVEPPSATDSASSLNRVSIALFSARLAWTDDADRPYPVLAESVPALETNSWQVRPDGRMETTWRLRGGLTWHDGRPLTAEDFVFGGRVRAAEIEWGLSQPSEESRKTEKILAPDPRTVVISWSDAYADAGRAALMPRPRHILQEILERDSSEAFASHPFWTTEYVGAGPYRLARWEPGAFIEGSAFEGYALGRPKIDRVRLTWSGDPNATVARLLSGDAHIALDTAIQFQQAAVLRREWGDKGTILLSPNQLRHLQVQHRAEYVKPQALLDARVRRALLHAIDRPSLAAALLEGEGVVAETYLPPTVGYYQELERQAAKYPFDLRRAEQLMAEAGFTRGADGFFLHSTEGRFTPELRGLSEGQEAQESAINADFLQRAGMDMQLNLVPAAQRAASDEFKATFSGLTANYATLNPDPGISKLVTGRIAAPENRWSGSNKSGWAHPAFDLLHERYIAALDPQERQRLMIEMVRLINNELPSLPLYFNFEVVAHRVDLRGPLAHAPAGTRYLNIHQWELR